MLLRWLALWVAMAPLAEAKIGFTGLAVAGADSRFDLQDGAKGGSQWVAIGGQFEGYTVKQFNAADETLLIANGTETLTLHLEDATIAAAAPATLLQPGALLRLTFPGERDLDREVRVSRDGNVVLPLIGRIHVAGLSAESAAAAISYACSHAQPARVLRFGAHLRILP